MNRNALRAGRALASCHGRRPDIDCHVHRMQPGSAERVEWTPAGWLATDGHDAAPAPLRGLR